MSCCDTIDIKVKNCVTTKVKEGCVDITVKGDYLPVTVTNEPVNVGGCLQVTPKETFGVTGCVKATNDETNPVPVDGCLKVQNKPCDPLCAIIEENIYDKTPKTFVGNASSPNEGTLIASVTVTGIDDCLFQAQKLTAAFCFNGSYLNCDTITVDLNCNGTTILNSVPVSQWPGKVQVVDKGAGKIFVRLELAYSQVNGCPKLMKEGDYIALTTIYTSGIFDSALFLTLNGCLRKCLNDCSDCFNKEEEEPPAIS